jgi:aldehyde dehydrogenase (NAD+)
MTDQFQLYIGGEWRDSASDGWIDVENPSTGEVIAQVPAGDTADVAAAAAAAAAAFATWSALPSSERVAHLRNWQRILDERRAEITEIVINDLGAPAKIADRVHFGLSQSVIADILDTVEKGVEEEQIGNSVIVREPYGVVAAITPWNYPLYQAVAKIVAALAAGCTVVLKPSEVAPLGAYELIRAAHDAGLPAGVLNLVSGPGPVIGEALATNADIDLVSFTGSTKAGRRVAELAGGQLKKVTLELGGKSANVLLPDADLKKAVKAGVADFLLNSGQTCRACTRMVVQEDSADAVAELLQAELGSWSVGDPRDPATRLGPLVSAAQKRRVLNYVQQGLDEGAVLIAGSLEELTGPGYFVSPVVLGNVGRSSTVAREEIFGPVLVVQTYTDEADALEVANDSDYGLAGAVWSADPDRANAFARKMRTGQVDVNGGRFNARAPFGGYKNSGFGRELGRFGLEEFQQIKALQL